MTGKQRAYLRSMCNTLPAIILVGKEGVTETLKRSDQMAWVGAMSSIRDRAEETVLNDLIYA